jgi:outer membrane protein OmpA-like peptidoglycan-associated protein
VDAPIERASARPVFFDAWSAQMTDETRAALTELAERAKSEPARRLLVVGHAAPGGSGEANALLARLRARVVADVLTEAGLPSNRVRVTYRVPVQGTEAVESRRVDVRLDDATPAPRSRR